MNLRKSISHLIRKVWLYSLFFLPFELTWWCRNYYLLGLNYCFHVKKECTRKAKFILVPILVQSQLLFSFTCLSEYLFFNIIWRCWSFMFEARFRCPVIKLPLPSHFQASNLLFLIYQNTYVSKVYSFSRFMILYFILYLSS